jgi:hypothetical protein
MNMFPSVRAVALIFVVVVIFRPAFQTGFAAKNAAAKSITTIDIDSEGRVHIVQSDGQEVVPPKEKDQVSVASARLAGNKLEAGWLVEFANCCTSYPIPLTLIIYRPGKPLERFGNGMMIADWHFEAGGKQVAFSTNTVHGDLVPQYELRDTSTGRLLDKWDGKLTQEAPAWTNRN